MCHTKTAVGVVRMYRVVEVIRVDRVVWVVRSAVIPQNDTSVVELTFQETEKTDLPAN